MAGMSKREKLDTTKIFSNLRELQAKQRNVLVFILSFALIGIIVMLVTRAATPTADLESEKGLIASPAISGLDSSASGGQYVQFKDVPAPEPPPPINANIDCNNPLNRFVTTTGNAQGDGTCAKPWDLKTALAHPATLKPGDFVWVRQGTYTGCFISEIDGTTDKPIIIRQAPNENVKLNGALPCTPFDYVLRINGSNSWFWGFEIMNANPVRIGGDGSVGPSGITLGVGDFGVNTKVINTIIHDTAQGLSVWSPAKNTEYYGNVIFHNGWDGSDRAHGHSIYAQNLDTTKRFLDNVMFSGFNHGFHGYGSQALNNFWLEGNIAFNSGSSGADKAARDYLVGGGSIAQSPTLISNYSYMSNGGQNNIGYQAGCTDAIIKDNYWAILNGPVLYLIKCTTGLTMTGNTFAGATSQFDPAAYPNNTYIPYLTRPTGLKIFIRPNKYEPGRSNIAIYNWDNTPTVSVNLSTTGLKNGQKYEIRDVQNFTGPAFMAGTYNAASPNVSITMNQTAVTQSINGKGQITHTNSEYGAFVVLPIP